MPLSEAAATISDLATEIQAETHRTVEVVEEACAGRKSRAAKVETARDAFREIGDSVTAMTSRIQEFAEATAEVAAVAGAVVGLRAGDRRLGAAAFPSSS